MPRKQRWHKILLYAALAMTVIGMTALTGTAIALPFTVQYSVYEAQSPVITPPPTAAQIPFRQPARLIIPSITVDAAIDHMGLTPNGAMEAPQEPQKAGWYKLGPHPGNKGTAVIAGHYGRWKSGASSVFDNLHKLRQGDRVSIQDEAGATVTFVVREQRMFGHDDNAPEVFTTPGDGSHLNLITCQGKWNEVQNTYTDRLVVFTDREP